MRKLQILCITAAIALTGAGAVLAQESYEPATLPGGFTLEIPAVVGETYKLPEGAPKDLLMSFEVSLGDPGSMSCQFKRYPYDKDLSRDDLVSGLAKGNAGFFCKAQGSGVSNYELSNSLPATADGAPAGTCTAAYTDASQEEAGKVVSMKVVAGKKAIYQLICVSETDDKDAAVVAYATRWIGVVSHMWASLKLPAEEK